RVTLRIPSPEATATVLQLHAVDHTGRLTLGISFDPDDLDAALAEADRLFLETEGAVHADVIGLVSAHIDALETRDTAAAAKLLTTDFVMRSHEFWVHDLVAEDWVRSLDVGFEIYSRPGRVRVDHVSDVSSAGGLWSVFATVDDDGLGHHEFRFLWVV